MLYAVYLRVSLSLSPSLSDGTSSIQLVCSVCWSSPPKEHDGIALDGCGPSCGKMPLASRTRHLTAMTHDDDTLFPHKSARARERERERQREREREIKIEER